MPTYEFRCLNCRRRFDVFMTYSEYGTRPVSCPHCKSEKIQRRITRVRIGHSEDSRLDNLTGPESMEGLEDDPRALGRMMREISREAGQDMGPEFNEVIGRLEAGQSPDQIEQDLPDLGLPGDDPGDGALPAGFSGGDLGDE